MLTSELIKALELSLVNEGDLPVTKQSPYGVLTVNSVCVDYIRKKNHRETKRYYAILDEQKEQKVLRIM